MCYLVCVGFYVSCFDCRSKLSQVADREEGNSDGWSDVGHTNGCVLSVDIRLAAFRRVPVGANRQVLRPVHGRRIVQLSSAGASAVTNHIYTHMYTPNTRIKHNKPPRTFQATFSLKPISITRPHSFMMNATRYIDKTIRPSVRPSVCLSVHDTEVLCQNGSTHCRNS